MECDICAESYSSNEYIPKCLPCGHTFCVICLATLYDSCRQKISCPNCRKAFKVNNLDDIPTNFTVVNSLPDDTERASANTVRCASHQDKIAKLVCMDCRFPMCSDCAFKSMTTKIHSNHSVKDVAEVSAPVEGEKAKAIAAIKEATNKATVEHDRKCKELNDLQSSSIGEIRKKASDIIFQVNQWRDSSIGNINRLCSEMKHQITTNYRNAAEQLQSADNVEQMGIFDISGIKNSYPTDSFRRAMEEFQTSSCSLVVTSYLKLEQSGNICKKVDSRAPTRKTPDGSQVR